MPSDTPQINATRPLGRGVGGARGFTLIELIMVLVLVGALAVFVAPRLNSSDFYALGFHDQTQAYLRYAQKTAIAQRRTVCVAFTLNSVTLTMSSTSAAFNCNTPAALTGPGGESPVVLNARTGIVYSALPTNFNFDGLGQPITSAGVALAKQTIQVANVGRSIVVETVTGYVHE